MGEATKWTAIRHNVFIKSRKLSHFYQKEQFQLIWGFAPKMLSHENEPFRRPFLNIVDSCCQNTSILMLRISAIFHFWDSWNNKNLQNHYHKLLWPIKIRQFRVCLLWQILVQFQNCRFILTICTKEMSLLLAWKF